MAYERIWSFNTSVLISNGAPGGIVRVLDIAGFFVKQKVLLRSNTQPDTSLEIKRIDYPNTIHLGPSDTDITLRADVTAFLVADAAYLTAFEQNFPKIKPEDIANAVYAREQIVANRVINVDKYGNYYDKLNPLPVDATISVVVPPLTVNLDALTPNTRPDPDNVLVAGSEDGTKTGLKHALLVDSNLDLHVKDTLSLAQLTAIAGSVSSIDTKIVTTVDGIKVDSKINNLPTDYAKETTLTSINNKLNTLGQKTSANSMPVVLSSDQPALPITLADEPIKISGTDNGQPNGPEFVIVNTLRQQILAAKDRLQALQYADFGTKDQRITRIDYTSPSIGSGVGYTARKNITYTLVGTKYRRDLISWSLI